MRQQVIDLFKKVAEMRAAQGRYFKTRSKDDLIASKRLEVEIDTEVPRLIKSLENK